MAVALMRSIGMRARLPVRIAGWSAKGRGIANTHVRRTAAAGMLLGLGLGATDVTLPSAHTESESAREAGRSFLFVTGAGLLTGSALLIWQVQKNSQTKADSAAKSEAASAPVGSGERASSSSNPVVSRSIWPNGFGDNKEVRHPRIIPPLRSFALS